MTVFNIKVGEKYSVDIFQPENNFRHSFTDIHVDPGFFIIFAD